MSAAGAARPFPEAAREALRDTLDGAGFDVVAREVVADGVQSVAEALHRMTDAFAGLVVTTGGPSTTTGASFLGVGAGDARVTSVVVGRLSRR